MIFVIIAVILALVQNQDNVQDARRDISITNDHVSNHVLLGTQETKTRGNALLALKAVKYALHLDIRKEVIQFTKCVKNVKKIGNLLEILLLIQRCIGISM